MVRYFYFPGSAKIWSNFVYNLIGIFNIETSICDGRYLVQLVVAYVYTFAAQTALRVFYVELHAK